MRTHTHARERLTECVTQRGNRWRQREREKTIEIEREKERERERETEGGRERERERERDRESERESERDYQAETRRHAGCTGAPRAGCQIWQQLDQCACKLEGAIVIATALVAAAQDVTNFHIEWRLFSRRRLHLL